MVDFLETLEHVEDSTLNVVLGRSCGGGEVRAVQSVGRLLGNGEGRSGARQTTQGYTGERHFWCERVRHRTFCLSCRPDFTENNSSREEVTSISVSVISKPFKYYQ
jgi:hypothetical protein